MTRAAEGRPGKHDGELQDRTVHGLLTKQRIHAIVGQVIDELENRRAAGKRDYVAALADEVEKGGLAALQQLKSLLPDDAKLPIGGLTMNVNHMYLEALKAADASAIAPVPEGAGVIVDVTPERKQSETMDW
jgi:hypothetical protein